MTVAVETGLWQLDPTASAVRLRHRTFWGLVAVKGTFTAVTGRGEVRPDGSAAGTVTLETASLDTGNAKRDAHLRSADLLDAGAHPEITYTATGAELLDGDGDGGSDGSSVRVTGRLTVHGVEQPLTLTARLAAATPGALTLETEFTVDRDRFGVSWNQLGMMRGLTTVTAALRFTRAAA
ncbi:YceI family protein [Streptomyces sp. LP11]|uniref:YceI family protein n=1 Tax=Streptomyces pyxinicus TaxID=2970331 RepID=A0ABT2B2J2_9ACTN|nr:YceI family protein [Streptomyces sp. LP11]MCS0602325.1 YceI family protein [Streptomyces sp. LP11]